MSTTLLSLEDQEMGKMYSQLVISVWSHFFCCFAYQHHCYFCLWSFHHCHLHPLCYSYFPFLFYCFLCYWLLCLLLISKIPLINISNFGQITSFLISLPNKQSRLATIYFDQCNVREIKYVITVNILVLILVFPLLFWFPYFEQQGKLRGFGKTTNSRLVKSWTVKAWL